MKKKMICLGLCAILSIGWMTGCGKVPKLQNGKEVVAKLDGKEFTVEDLYVQLKNQAGTSILINMIDEYIASKEVETDKGAENYAASQIEQLKYYCEQTGEDYKQTLLSGGYANESEYRNALILNYKKNTTLKNFLKEEVTEDELKKYHEENVFGDITARHILIKPVTKEDMSDEDKEKAEKEALEKAKEVIKKLDEGAKFEDLVKEYSDDTASVEDGGLIKDFNSDSVVSEFFDAANKLENGKYSKEPVKSQFGYHIILKESQKEKPTLEDAKDNMLEEIVTTRLNEDSTLSSKTWIKIRAKYKLSIHDDYMKDLYDTVVENTNKK